MTTPFTLTEQEAAEVERAQWYASRGMVAPYTSTVVLLDALARAVGSGPSAEGANEARVSAELLPPSGPSAEGAEGS